MEKKKYTKEEVEQMSADEVYAAWGTTEEKEMDWLMGLVNSEIREPKKPVVVKKLRPRPTGAVRMAAANEKNKKKTKKDKED